MTPKIATTRQSNPGSIEFTPSEIWFWFKENWKPLAISEAVFPSILAFALIFSMVRSSNQKIILFVDVTVDVN